MKKWVIYVGILIVLVLALALFFDSEEKEVDRPGNVAEVSIGVGESEEAIENLNEVNPPVTETLGVSLSDLATHDNKDDCWVGFEGKAYDLTSWLDRHPGGSLVISRHCGTAEDFERSFIGKHMRGKVDKLGEYYVGDL